MIFCTFLTILKFFKFFLLFSSCFFIIYLKAKIFSQAKLEFYHMRKNVEKYFSALSNIKAFQYIKHMRKIKKTRKLQFFPKSLKRKLDHSKVITRWNTRFLVVIAK